MLQADLANIAKKLKAGKTLNATERNTLREEEAEIDSPAVPATVKNYVELGKILGVDRRTIQTWRKEEGSPRASTNGTHNVQAWLDFQMLHGKKGGKIDEGEDNLDLPSEPILKRKKLLLFCQEKEMILAVRRGELIALALVRETWQKKCAEANSHLRKRLENELPSELEGLEAADIYDSLVSVVDEFCEIMHGGGVELK